MNILFICRYNRFRSVLAEGIFNSLQTNHKAKSAGLFKGNPIDTNTKKIAKYLKIKIKKHPQAISSKLLAWQDKIVIVADDVPPIIFKDKYKNDVTILKIKDADANKQAEKVAKEVEKKVKAFAKTL